jgi:hypothetical protein
MDRQLLDDTITYVRKELTSIHQDLTWADGSQAESFRVRQMRLLAELDRLESLRRIVPISAGTSAGMSVAAVILGAQGAQSVAVRMD